MASTGRHVGFESWLECHLMLLDFDQAGGKHPPGRKARPRRRATYTRTGGVRHLFAAYELGEDKMFARIKPRKTRARFLQFCRYLRSLYPTSVRIAIIYGNFSPHLTTARTRGRAVGPMSLL